MIGFALFAAWASIGLHAADRYWAGLPNPCPHTYVSAIVDGGAPVGGNFRDDRGDCIVWINTADGPFTGHRVCQIVVHEIGHLRGLQHSANPRSLMYPSLSATSPLPAGCRSVQRGRA